MEQSKSKPANAEKQSVGQGFESNKTDQSQVRGEEDSSSAILNEARWEYQWVSQNHPTQNYPDNWTFAVELLLSYKRDKVYDQYGFNSETSASGKKQRGLMLKAVEKKSLKNCVYVPLPRALTLNCTNSHLHKWKSDILDDMDEEVRDQSAFIQGRIKVICINGYIYRLAKTLHLLATNHTLYFDLLHVLMPYFQSFAFNCHLYFIL